MPATRYPLHATILRRYFYSGWAFLIPYLAAYLLYYLTGWPVNPASPTGEAAPASALTPLTPYTSYSLIPSLLHLYWSLHAIHLLLAVVALRSWWTENSAQYVRSASDSQSAPYSSYRLHLLTRIAPWAIIALIFHIPGVYLEWPSDPWEHLRRINEWRLLDTVGIHSTWAKSSYFIPYSFLSWCTGQRQLFWLDFYYTGICLLLCWQYYRLSRACGLSERTSMVFVFLQALLFGNSIFSFYRYYGISSTIYAQLGAVALTRIALEFAVKGTNLEPSLERDTEVPANPNTLSAHELPSAPPCDSLLSLICQPLKARPSFWHLPWLLLLAGILLSLLPLIAFNHSQGIGIAMLGTASVTIWRLIAWRRSALFWLIIGTVLLNLSFLWVYPRPAIIEIYHSQSWLSDWYGFNVFQGAARDRLLQVASAWGVVAVLASLSVLVFNHPASWLTIVPYIAIPMPLFAVPFSILSASQSGENHIVVFSRVLFASPTVLPLLVLLAKTRTILSTWLKMNRHNATPFLYSQTVLVLGAIITLSPRAPLYNRSFHSVGKTPKDLQISYAADGAMVPNLSRASTVITSFGTGAALQAFGLPRVRHAWRRINGPVSDLAINSINAIFTAPKNSYALIPYNVTAYSHTSQAAVLSKHWPAQQVACEQVNAVGLTNLARQRPDANHEHHRSYVVYGFSTADNEHPDER